MRIAIVADPSSPHTRVWVEALAAAGDELALFSPYRQPPPRDLPATITAPLLRAGPLVPAGDAAPTRASRAPADPRRLRTLTRALRLVPAFRRWVRRTRPELLLALRLQPEGYLAACGGVRPCAIVSWGQDVLRVAYAHPLHRLWSGHAVRRADLLMGETDAVVAALRDLGGRASSCLKGMTGIDVDFWHPPDDARAPLALLRRAWPREAPWIDALEQGRPLILSPRAIARHGHQRELIEAVGRVGDPGAILVQTGSGDPSERAHCRALAERLGLRERYVDLGPVDRETLRALFARAAVVCSLWSPDGLSQTLLECMAVGGLPLAADLPGNREWIEDGVNGLLVDPHRPEAIAAALERRPPAARAGALNRRLAVERASRTAQMARLIGALHALEERR